MFDEDQNKKNGDDPKKAPGSFKMPPASWFAWIAIIGSLGVLMMVKGRMGAPAIADPFFLQPAEPFEVCCD